jgi:hypothetical protein
VDGAATHRAPKARAEGGARPREAVALVFAECPARPPDRQSPGEGAAEARGTTQAPDLQRPMHRQSPGKGATEARGTTQAPDQQRPMTSRWNFAPGRYHMKKALRQN